MTSKDMYNTYDESNISYLYPTSFDNRNKEYLEAASNYENNGFDRNVLYIGKQGENLAHNIKFNFSEWFEEYGDGVLSLNIQRNGDIKSYNIPLEILDEDLHIAIWNITKKDTDNCGKGLVELQYKVNDVVVKSQMFETFVYSSISSNAVFNNECVASLVTVLNSSYYFLNSDNTYYYPISFDLKNAEYLEAYSQCINNGQDENQLQLGKQGEHLAHSIDFDYSNWVSEYGQGEITLTVKRSGDKSSYPVILETEIVDEKHVARWNITSIDTAKPGKGWVELEYKVDDKIIRSQLFETNVLSSIVSPDILPPDPYISWVNQLIVLGDKTYGYYLLAKEAANHYPYINTDTNTWMVWNVETEQYDDTGTNATGPKGEDGTQVTVSATGVSDNIINYITIDDEQYKIGNIEQVEQQLTEEINKKQDKIIPGENVSLDDNNVLSFIIPEDLREKTYIHVQRASSDNWHIVHNLKKYPSVSIVDSADSLVIGNIDYINENELDISFVGAFSGKAYLN